VAFEWSRCIRIKIANHPFVLSPLQFGLEGMDSVIQNSVLDVQLSMEECLTNVLKARGKPAVLLFDRGPMDGAA
jgi:hypothetical protein